MSLEQMMQTVMEDTAYLPQSNLTLTARELTGTDGALGSLFERPIHTIIKWD